MQHIEFGKQQITKKVGALTLRVQVKYFCHCKSPTMIFRLKWSGCANVGEDSDLAKKQGGFTAICYRLV